MSFALEVLPQLFKRKNNQSKPMWNPEDYAKNSDAQLEWARSLTENINLEEYKSVFDVGCGDGKITADFAHKSPNSRIIGIDSSLEMTNYAKDRYPVSKYPNLTFTCMDAREIAFSAEFDLVFSNATLHWVDNHQAFLQGANQALRNSGRLIISCGGKGNAAQILDTFAELTTNSTWKAHFQDFYNPYFFYGLEDYQTWLRESGFKIRRLELVPKDMTHQGKSGLAGWIRTTWMPFIRHIPEAQKDEFIAQFVELYINKQPLDSQGFTHVSMVRLEVDADKTFKL